jgi:hypothetical protein
MCVRPLAVALVASALLLSQTAWAAPPSQSDATPRPPQGNPAARKAGRGSIAGTIKSGEDSKPLPRARVIIRSAALPQPRVSIADERGAYTFAYLPAGEYELVVVRSGYALPYASAGPSRGIAVRLNDGEARTRVDLALQRAGTIPGRLVDEDGTPLAGAEIEALSLRATDPQQPLASVSSARTDDRGEFRLTGLPAGQYFVVARDPAFSNIGDESGRLRYAPTYFPGVLSSAEAEPVSVTAGREAARVEFRLRLVRPARVSGIMATEHKTPLLSGAMILVHRDRLAAAAMLPEDAEIFPDGRFVFRNVAPGHYEIRAQAEVKPRDSMVFGTIAIAVDGRDIDDISMALTPGAIVQGRVEWVPARPSRLRQIPGLRVRAPFSDGSSFGDSLTGDVASNGTFRLRGVMTGRHYFTLEGLPEPWHIQAVLLRGQHTMLEPVDTHEGEQLYDVVIVVSDKVSVITGTVRDDSGRPRGDALVVAMSQSPALWSRASPRFRTTRADEGGQYQVRGLPSGSYRLAAVAGMDEHTAWRREWLDTLYRHATAFSLSSAEVRALDLTALEASTLARPADR